MTFNERKREPRFLTQSDDDDHRDNAVVGVAGAGKIRARRDVTATYSIGPDSLLMLRHLSRSYTQDRNAFDRAIMPRTPAGEMIGRINVSKMEFADSPEIYGTYGHFINGQVASIIVRLKREMAMIHDSAAKVAKVDQWLREAVAGSPLMWALSCHSIRSVIFPGAYVATGDSQYPLKRIDGVVYGQLPPTLKHLEGRQTRLFNLEPQTVMRFNAHVLRVTRDRYQIDTMGPVSL